MSRRVDVRLESVCGLPRHDLLHHNDRVVDEQPEYEHESGNRDQVQRQPERKHQRERDGHRQAHTQQHHNRCADTLQHEQQDKDDEHRAEPAAPAQVAHLFADVLAPIADDKDPHAVRRSTAKLFDLVEHTFRNFDKVARLRTFDAKGYDGLSVDAGDAPLRRLREFNGSDIRQSHGTAIIRHFQYDVADIADVFFRWLDDQSRSTAFVDPPEHAILNGGPDFEPDAPGVESEVIESIGIERDEHLALRAAGHNNIRHTLDASNLRRDDFFGQTSENIGLLRPDDLQIHEPDLLPQRLRNRTRGVGEDAFRQHVPEQRKLFVELACVVLDVDVVRYRHGHGRHVFFGEAFDLGGAGNALQRALDRRGHVALDLPRRGARPRRRDADLRQLNLRRPLQRHLRRRPRAGDEQRDRPGGGGDGAGR